MSTSFPVRILARVLRISALFVLVSGALPLLAKPVKPPLDQLYASPNLLVAGTLVEINPAGRLVFERGEVLGGAPLPPEKIDVRASAPVLSDVKVGERYIFGYANVHTDRNTVDRKLAANRVGAILLSSTGIEPALFRDTPEVRALLHAGRTGKGRDSRAFVDLLVQALDGDDAQLRLLAAGQIALDPDVRERLRRPDRTVARNAARDPSTPPMVRTLLLHSAEQSPDQLGDWWRAAAIDIVTTTPADGYARRAPDPTGLVLMALELLDKHVVKVPADALERWLRSPAPVLAEHASLMLRRESPAVERSAIREALADPQLPAQTRLFLNDHLRRLDRHGSAETRKEGTG